ncbi:protein IX [Bat mastadenovirus]|nr:protein IX [Bat mastadenovirus]
MAANGGGASSNKEKGSINTAFLTCKLPAWAGVRQDITGSDIHGYPVRPTNFATVGTTRYPNVSPAEPQTAAEPPALAASGYSSHHVDLVQSTAAALLQLTSKIDGLAEKVAQLEQTMAVVYATLAEPEAMDEEEEGPVAEDPPLAES